MMQCFPDSSQMPDILVVSDSSAQAEPLIGGLQAFGSPECVAAATVFLCVHVFQGVCDENGTHYFPTAGECEELNSGVCQTEFELSRSIGMEIVDCTVLPTDSPFLQCPNGSQEVVMPDIDENGMLKLQLLEIKLVSQARINGHVAWVMREGWSNTHMRRPRGQLYSLCRLDRIVCAHVCVFTCTISLDLPGPFEGCNSLLPPPRPWSLVRDLYASSFNCCMSHGIIQ